jgi:hypothetical protein
MKIGHLSVASLHMMEDFGFHGAVIRHLSDLPLSDGAVGYTPGLKQAAQAFKTVFQEWDDAVNATSGPTPAAVAKKIDRQRVRTWREMRAFVRASMAFPDEKVAEVARRAADLFKAYGNMPQKSETGRSGRMKNLTDTLRNLGAEALEKARLTPFLEKLEQENEVHFAATERRAMARGARVKGLLRAKRMATDAAYHTLVETVNALILVNGEAPYQAFTASLTGEISHAHTKLATRRTILAKHRAARKAKEEAKN